MDAHTLALAVLSTGCFLLSITFLRSATKVWQLPYTVGLLLLGFVAQALVHRLDLHVPLSLSTDIVYYGLLPILLFESALHMNYHQFRLQFKTISFLATFGLLVSASVVATLLTWWIGLPLGVALMFGTLISATDPIAVLALFKSLGAPKRLGLIAEGESMLNDATGVIAFRSVSAFVITQSGFSTLSLAQSSLTFIFTFFGSLAIGAMIGLVFGSLLARIQHDRIAETTLTVAAAYLSFIWPEMALGASGVMSAVAAGLVLSHVGRTRFSSSVTHFVSHFWEWTGYVAVSAVFFFATFDLNVGVFSGNIEHFVLVVLAVLLGRAVSVYFSFFLTNTLWLFRNEPNTPLSWQHVLTWGGLRGVIPLVLVYSLPQDFLYRELFLSYTLVAFLATLFLNGTTIKQLLAFLKLDVPPRTERITAEEHDFFAWQSAEKVLDQLEDEGIDQHIIHRTRRQLHASLSQQRQQLTTLVTPKELFKSLKLEAIVIERNTLQDLYDTGNISERVFYTFNHELDLQQDAIEYPGIVTRHTTSEGKIDSQSLFWNQLRRIQKGGSSLFTRFFNPYQEARFIHDRFSLLQARITSSAAVRHYLDRVAALLEGHPRALEAVRILQHEHEQLQLKNSLQMESIAREYPRDHDAFQQHIVDSHLQAHYRRLAGER